MHVLLVEDDAETREYVAGGLRERGFVVDTADRGDSGLEMITTGAYDVVVLDVRLPGFDGFEVMRRVRSAGVGTPVLFLSAQGEVQHRIEGLNLGADDYLTKPFAMAELLARIRAIARRSLPDGEKENLVVADLTLDLEGRSARRGDARVDLTQKEFQLLEYLLRHRGQAVSRTMIIESIWGYGFDTYSNVIDVHINNLRKKIDRDFEPKLIHTLKGFGYVLEDRRPGAG